MINTAKREALIEMIRDFASAKNYLLDFVEIDGGMRFIFTAPFNNYKKHEVKLRSMLIYNIFTTFENVTTRANSVLLSSEDDSLNYVIDTDTFAEYTKNDIKTTAKVPRKIPRKIPPITKIKFNPPATIIFWADDTKTVVKAHDEDFDPEKGVAMAIAKKALGNKGNYYNEIRKCLDEYIKQQWADIDEVHEHMDPEISKVIEEGSVPRGLMRSCETCIHRDKLGYEVPCNTCIATLIRPNYEQRTD